MHSTFYSNCDVIDTEQIIVNNILFSILFTQPFYHSVLCSHTPAVSLRASPRTFMFHTCMRSHPSHVLLYYSIHPPSCIIYHVNRTLGLAPDFESSNFAGERRQPPTKGVVGGSMIGLRTMRGVGFAISQH